MLTKHASVSIINDLLLLHTNEPFSIFLVAFFFFWFCSTRLHWAELHSSKLGTPTQHFDTRRLRNPSATDPSLHWFSLTHSKRHTCTHSCAVCPCLPKWGTQSPIIITHPLSLLLIKGASWLFWNQRAWTCSLLWCLKMNYVFSPSCSVADG